MKCLPFPEFVDCEVCGKFLVHFGSGVDINGNGRVVECCRDCACKLHRDCENVQKLLRFASAMRKGGRAVDEIMEALLADEAAIVARWRNPLDATPERPSDWIMCYFDTLPMQSCRFENRMFRTQDGQDVTADVVFWLDAEAQTNEKVRGESETASC